jgi:hypothetical protein
MYSRNDKKARKKGQQSPHSWWMVVQGKAQFLIHIFSSFNAPLSKSIQKTFLLYRGKF